MRGSYAAVRACNGCACNRMDAYVKQVSTGKAANTREHKARSNSSRRVRAARPGVKRVRVLARLLDCEWAFACAREPKQRSAA
eukprot:6206636-Pleurochrysis_carterae.AAC.2